MTYVIHGATGAQGGPVLSALEAAGRPVVALTRNVGSTGSATRTVRADCASVEQLVGAYRQATGVFVHLPIGTPDDQRAYSENIASALIETRPTYVVVSTSGQIIDRPGSPLQQSEDGAIPSLIHSLEGAGVSHAVIAPRLYLENLVQMIAGARAEGVLRYPLRADIPVSWASHLDVADAAVALFDRHLTGVVAVGQHPGVTGPELAAALSERFCRTIEYEALTPEQFGTMIAPAVGPAAAAGIAALYSAINASDHHSFDIASSAQIRLDLTPRTTAQWLDDLSI